MERVGPYRITGELGRGATSIVLRAVDPGGREVALKLLHPFDRGAERRFEREVEALRLLRHPHVVTVQAAGVEHGRPWVAMDLVEGGTLQDRLDRTGPLASAEAARLVQRLALAVAHAHARGVLHRDLKPANVLLSGGREPLLTDFGLARALETGSSLTRSGAALGTPGYWPPEQAAGKLDEVGARSDVWGLGAILYAALTGVPPFQGAGLAEVVEATLSTTPRPPSRLVAGVDPELERVCLCCLERDPAGRFESASAVAAALGRLARGRSRRLGPARAAAAVLLLAGASVALAVAWSGRAEPAGAAPLAQEVAALLARAGERARTFEQERASGRHSVWGPLNPAEAALDEAVALTRRAVELAPGEAEPLRRHVGLQVTRAGHLLRTGRDPEPAVQEGLRAAPRLFELAPGESEGFLRAARLHHHRRERLRSEGGDQVPSLRAALGLLDQACRLAPGSLEAHDLLGLTAMTLIHLEYAAGHLQPDQTYFERTVRGYGLVIEKGPPDWPSVVNGDAFVFRGTSRLALGDQGGVEDVRRALAIRPESRKFLTPNLQALVDGKD